ncbi:MAG: hypothetical protein UR94_C0008G0004 [Parcubacteria group bacterium GW2011_GWA2_36_10]|nr:MAG: hypothetical protein UR94_C0008G0004 [Parcubacteria group bacterium GW2011_GWA2_36_10]
MAIILEQLDNEYNEETCSILLGKHFVLKFSPDQKRNILHSNQAIENLINTENLLVSPILGKVNSIVSFSKNILKELGENIKFQDFLNKIAKSGLSKSASLSSILNKSKEDILQLSNDIQKIEKDNDLFLAQDRNLYFCESCNAYLGETSQLLPPKCTYCQTNTNWSASHTAVRFVDSQVADYLTGLWFEDYMAKLLNSLGWKTWCHGSIMGSSGIDHQVDILAINNSQGRTLIGECKTGKINKEQVFDLSAQYYDIKSNLGFLFSLQPVDNNRLKDYMKRTAGLCLLDNLKRITDEEIKKQIQNNL